MHGAQLFSPVNDGNIEDAGAARVVFEEAGAIVDTDDNPCESAESCFLTSDMHILEKVYVHGIRGIEEY